MSRYDLYLSYTGFTKYVECPQNYYLEYIEKKRPKVEDQRNVLNGNTLHNLLEEYIHLGKNDPRWLVHNVERVWEETLEGCEHVVWRHEDDAQELKDKAKKWSYALGKLLYDYKIDPATCEPELKADSIVQVGKYKVKMGARLDIVMKNAYNDYAFLDLKASENRRVMKLDQIVWYSIVLGEYLGKSDQPKKGGYLLPGFNELKMYSIPMQAKVNLMNRLEAAVGGIKNGEWEPKPEDQRCFWCPVKFSCPVKGKAIPHGSGTIYLE